MTMPEKSTILPCKITLPESPHPIIISNNHGFWALHPTGRNEFRFFRLIDIFKNILHFWLLTSAPKICRKNNGFVQFRGAAALPAPLLVYAYVHDL